MTCSLTKMATLMVLASCLACTPETGEDDDGPSSTSEASASVGPSTADDPSGATTIEPSTSGSTDPTAGSTADTLDGTTDVPACEQPLEQTVLDQLFIDAGMTTFIPAGSDTQLRLVWIDAGFPTEVDACVEWSLAPVDGVAIDDTGLLSIDAAVPAGTVVSVTADVEAGRRVLMAEFEVYVPLASDIIGYWTEVAQVSCEGTGQFDPDPVIGELVFQDTGEFSVTWTPFEVYYDYWGTYTYDEATGALVLSVDGGNYVPPDIDGEGTAMVAGGQLTLTDMWLGVAQMPVTPVACGHVFE